jgi:hypothetical protein
MYDMITFVYNSTPRSYVVNSLFSKNRVCSIHDSWFSIVLIIPHLFLPRSAAFCVGEKVSKTHTNRKDNEISSSHFTNFELPPKFSGEFNKASGATKITRSRLQSTQSPLYIHSKLRNGPVVDQK